MNETSFRKRDLEASAWGALFVWWGITGLLPWLPAGSGALGSGLILLGLNAARHFLGIPTSFSSITMGVLAVAWGGLELAGVILALPFDIPIFPILLVVLGGVILAREIFASRNPAIGRDL